MVASTCGDVHTDPTPSLMGLQVWADGKFVSGVAGVTAGTSDGKDFTFSVGSGRYSFVVATPNTNTV